MSIDRYFNILALDGGGVRGIYAAQILAGIENSYGVQVKDCFDLLVGTSTGSIIAGGAAVGISMEKIVKLFEDESSRIFPKSPFRLGLFRSKYSRRHLDQALQTYLPSVTLGDIPSALMITSSDISTGGVYVFKSKYIEELSRPYVRDRNTPLREAIAASCSAPFYFDPATVGEHQLADGGLWANNPSITVLAEAMSKFNKNIDEIRMLSIGTGHTPNMYHNQKYWGILTGWGSKKLVSYLLSLQSQASTDMSNLLLRDRYLRLDPEIGNWALDDTKYLGNLKALANRDFASHANEIQSHLKGMS